MFAEEAYTLGLVGSVAEVGVYQGAFAEMINICFPDRKFYLFDTFEGFSPKDIQEELNQGIAFGNQDFKNTSVQRVLYRMKHPDKCIIKKGYFPATAVDIDDDFVFISLDADLYAPILSGLEFFYP
ncbi:MAG: methyltransferase, partial [Holophagaceae bacterium]|nr:methyltransferase [Candidatus Geothrix skivensis]